MLPAACACSGAWQFFCLKGGFKGRRPARALKARDRPEKGGKQIRAKQDAAHSTVDF